MKATVTNTFNDAILKKLFRVGDEYPVDKVDVERIELLTRPHPKTGKVYVFVDGQQEPLTDDVSKGEKEENPSPIVTEEAKPKPSRKKQTPEPSNDGE